MRFTELVVVVIGVLALAVMGTSKPLQVDTRESIAPQADNQIEPATDGVPNVKPDSQGDLLLGPAHGGSLRSSTQSSEYSRDSSSYVAGSHDGDRSNGTYVSSSQRSEFSRDTSSFHAVSGGSHENKVEPQCPPECNDPRYRTPTEHHASTVESFREVDKSRFEGSHVQVEVSKPAGQEHPECPQCSHGPLEASRDFSHYSKETDRRIEAGRSAMSGESYHGQNEQHRSTDFSHQRHQTSGRHDESTVGSDKTRFTGSRVEIDASQPSNDGLAAICRQCQSRPGETTRGYIHYHGANGASALNRGVGAFLLLIITAISCYY